MRQQLELIMTSFEHFSNIFRTSFGHFSYIFRTFFVHLSYIFVHLSAIFRASFELHLELLMNSFGRIYERRMSPFRLQRYEKLSTKQRISVFFMLYENKKRE